MEPLSEQFVGCLCIVVGGIGIAEHDIDCMEIF